MKQLENQAPADKTDEAAAPDNGADAGTPRKRSGRLFAFFLFLIVVAALAAGGWFGWQEFTRYRLATQTQISELQVELEQKASRSALDDALAPLKQSIGRSDSRLAQLEQQQQALLESTEKLYALYGRDENGWKLAEIEYLMSIAQHKLVLEHDFAGAATTLDAASQLIGELADPGLLPVRVQISEEIASLKTRTRPDLVGMTLQLARLERQIGTLKPGYQSGNGVESEQAPEQAPTPQQDTRSYEQKALDFVKSLVTVKRSSPSAQARVETAILDVTEKLEDNLKLTRWTVLERDATQYRRLMEENVALFEEYYDLDNAANADFHAELVELKQSPIKPDLPDISGSLQMLREIIKRREESPLPAQPEADNG